MPEHAPNDPKVSPGADEFFVGYLPTPPGQKRFIRVLIAVLIPTVIAAGVVIARLQRDPGGGVWEIGTVRDFDGVVRAEPYAMLRTLDDEGGVRTLLLVSTGKFGAVQRVRAVDGKAVRINGTILRRDGRWLLELADGDDAVRPAEPAGDVAAKLRVTEPVLHGRVTLRGEIIDPKCYIGAMKPGGGKTHKACAQLCVGGGIPPMFVTRDAAGRETFYLLERGDGGPAHQDVLPFLGDPVELVGELSRQDDLLVIRIDDAGIRPVSGE
jgi:hypothetical protein